MQCTWTKFILCVLLGLLVAVQCETAASTAETDQISAEQQHPADTPAPADTPVPTDTLPPVDTPAPVDGPLVCIIIRTYWAHGKYGNNSLANMLKGFQQQTYKNWEAQLIVLDNRAFPDLRYIIKDLEDERIGVFAEWVSYKYAPRNEQGQWIPGYHGKLYNLTDQAISACPPETEWVLVTNGDNRYDPMLLHELLHVGDADIVAYDYYSRYQRPTGPACTRFASGEGLSNCKENGVQWCQTDLSANVYRWKKMMKEGRSFGLADPTGISADGILAQQMLNDGWKVHHVRDKCLVEHAPTPQVCATLGGVWDDSKAATLEETGGACITQVEAETRMANTPGLERIDINVTHSTSFGLPEGDLILPCLRHKDPQQWDLLRFFGPTCASRFDQMQWDE